MIPRRTLIWLVALSAALALGGTAFAGIEPVPWHTVITNRTDIVATGSMFYRATMTNMVLTVTLAGSGTDALGETVRIELGSSAAGDRIPSRIAPGETLAVSLGDPMQIVSWTFEADLEPESSGIRPLGIEPVPWHVFAFGTRIAAKPDPYVAPSLAPSYLTPETPILGFASPGVIVGAVQLVSDAFYSACPSVPDAGSAWKNHGQYVRCIAHQVDWLTSTGQILADDADGIVSAAAQSGIGKK